MNYTFQRILIPDLDADLKNFHEKYKLEDLNAMWINKYENYQKKQEENKINLYDISRTLNKYMMFDTTRLFNMELLFANFYEFLDIEYFLYYQNKAEYHSLKSYIHADIEMDENTYKTVSHNYVDFIQKDMVSCFFQCSKNDKRYKFTDNFGKIFEKACKNTNKSPFHRSKDASLKESEIIQRLNIHEYTDKFKSFAFLNSYFEEMLLLDGIENTYLVEKLFGVRTAVYLSTVIHRYETDDEITLTDQQIYDIMSAMIYVFMFPNVFCRKGLIDDIMEKCKKWEYNPLFDFHRNITSEESDMYLEDAAKRVYRNKEILIEQIKKSMLSVIFTQLPLLKLLSLVNLDSDIKKKNFVDDIKKKYNANFKNLFGKEFYIDKKFSVSDRLSTPRSKDIFCKIYRFLSMKLFNEETLQKWTKCIDIDYTCSRYLSTMVLSFLEVEKINFFENSHEPFYDVGVKKQLVENILEQTKDDILKIIL